eukprot:TRINITY_DN25557_c0_g1_i3.p1 TRINITY_DN25557_c0_g1~~TRINITY_DN25557_c0_g1_i3.p1  ORF type:complete len:996 (-),score=216.78 TRINITY_DN25557_c0_g1_i3:16-3003(-)
MGGPLSGRSVEDQRYRLYEHFIRPGSREEPAEAVKSTACRRRSCQAAARRVRGKRLREVPALPCHGQQRRRQQEHQQPERLQDGEAPPQASGAWLQAESPSDEVVVSRAASRASAGRAATAASASPVFRSNTPRLWIAAATPEPPPWPRRPASRPVSCHSVAASAAAAAAAPKAAATAAAAAATTSSSSSSRPASGPQRAEAVGAEQRALAWHRVASPPAVTSVKQRPASAPSGQHGGVCFVYTNLVDDSGLPGYPSPQQRPLSAPPGPRTPFRSWVREQRDLKQAAGDDALFVAAVRNEEDLHLFDDETVLRARLLGQALARPTQQQRDAAEAMHEKITRQLTKQQEAAFAEMFTSYMAASRERLARKIQKGSGLAPACSLLEDAGSEDSALSSSDGCESSTSPNYVAAASDNAASPEADLGAPATRFHGFSAYVMARLGGEDHLHAQLAATDGVPAWDENGLAFQEASSPQAVACDGIMGSGMEEDAEAAAGFTQAEARQQEEATLQAAPLQSGSPAARGAESRLGASPAGRRGSTVRLRGLPGARRVSTGLAAAGARIELQQFVDGVMKREAARAQHTPKADGLPAHIRMQEQKISRMDRPGGSAASQAPAPGSIYAAMGEIARTPAPADYDVDAASSAAARLGTSDAVGEAHDLLGEVCHQTTAPVDQRSRPLGGRFQLAAPAVAQPAAVVQSRRGSNLLWADVQASGPGQCGRGPVCRRSCAAAAAEPSVVAPDSRLRAAALTSPLESAGIQGRHGYRFSTAPTFRMDMEGNRKMPLHANERPASAHIPVRTENIPLGPSCDPEVLSQDAARRPRHVVDCNFELQNKEGRLQFFSGVVSRVGGDLVLVRGNDSGPWSSGVLTRSLLQRLHARNVPGLPPQEFLGVGSSRKQDQERHQAVESEEEELARRNRLNAIEDELQAMEDMEYSESLLADFKTPTQCTCKKCWVPPPRAQEVKVQSPTKSPPQQPPSPAVRRTTLPPASGGDDSAG